MMACIVGLIRSGVQVGSRSREKSTAIRSAHTTLSLERNRRVEDDLRMVSLNSFGTRTRLTAGGSTFDMFSLPALEKAGFPAVSRLTFSLKILLENLLRREDGRFVDPDDIRAMASWDVASTVQKEIAFTPARVL